MLPRTLIAAADFCRWWLQRNLTLRRLYHPLLNRLTETLSWTRVFPDTECRRAVGGLGEGTRRAAERDSLLLGLPIFGIPFTLVVLVLLLVLGFRNHPNGSLGSSYYASAGEDIVQGSAVESDQHQKVAPLEGH